VHACFWNNLYKVCSKWKVWKFRCLTTRVHILMHMIQTLCFPKIEIKMRKEQISLFRLAIGIVRPVWYCLFFTLFVNIFYVICVCLRIVVSNKYWVIFSLCLSSSCAPLLPVSFDCPFLIAPSVFSNVYLKKRVTIYILMVQFFSFATSTGKYIACPREKWSLTNSFLASSQVIMGIHWPCYCNMEFIVIVCGILCGLTQPHFCACPKPGSGFPTSYAVVHFVCVQWFEVRCDCSGFFISGIVVIVFHNLKDIEII
jgi:hypothetical protein